MVYDKTRYIYWHHFWPTPGLCISASTIFYCHGLDSQQMHRVHGCHSWFYSLYRSSLCRWWCSVHWLPIQIARDTDHLRCCCRDHGITHIMAENEDSEYWPRYIAIFSLHQTSGQRVEAVDQFVYLGSAINSDGWSTHEIIGLVWPLVSWADCLMCGSNPDSAWQPSWEFTTHLSCLFSCTDVKRGPYWNLTNGNSKHSTCHASDASSEFASSIM